MSWVRCPGPHKIPSPVMDKLLSLLPPILRPVDPNMQKRDGGGHILPEELTEARRNPPPPAHNIQGHSRHNLG
ncbi:hypothetical protein PRBEI_2001082900 [Prionailurus iriomotensis]